MLLNDYDAVIGYKNGIVKGVELKKNKFKYTDIVEKTSTGLNSINYYGEDKIILSYNRAVTVHDLKRKKCVIRHNVIEQGNVVDAFRINSNLIAGVNNGIVSIMPPKYNDYKHLKKIKTGVPISCIRKGLTLDNVAIGGNESPLKIWDLATETFSFIAKRPKPDMLQLQQPCNVSDIRFFNNNKVIVSHRHGVLDIHDPLSAQRRPVLSLSSDKGFVCLQIMPDHSENEVIVGTSKGSMFHYDFRGKSKLPAKTFRGSVGSVKAVSFINYSNEMQLMSVSLDCQVRVHNFASGDILLQDYMALRPSALLTKIDVMKNL